MDLGKTRVNPFGQPNPYARLIFFFYIFVLFLLFHLFYHYIIFCFYFRLKKLKLKCVSCSNVFFDYFRFSLIDHKFVSLVFVLISNFGNFYLHIYYVTCLFQNVNMCWYYICTYLLKLCIVCLNFKKLKSMLCCLKKNAFFLNIF